MIAHLSTIDDMAQHVQTMIPLQVLADIDNARNPMQLTRDRLERAATENQFMNGKIVAIGVSSDYHWLILLLILVYSLTKNTWTRLLYSLFRNWLVI